MFRAVTISISGTSHVGSCGVTIKRMIAFRSLAPNLQIDQSLFHANSRLLNLTIASSTVLS